MVLPGKCLPFWTNQFLLHCISLYRIVFAASWLHRLPGVLWRLLANCLEVELGTKVIGGSDAQ